jgi:hypothetical protein
VTAPAPPEPAVAAAPGTYPVPAGRGRWRLTVHRRVYGSGATPKTTGVAELVDARSRRLETNWCQAAQLTFTLDGRSPDAATILELVHDVIAWRWDDQTGIDIPMFRGPVTQSEDQLTDSDHTVNFTVHDYLAMLTRRILTSPTPLNFTQTDQDTIAAALLTKATRPVASSGADVFWPGSSLPLAFAAVGPDGSNRSNSGRLRDRSYLGGATIGELLDNLAKVINGFDYDVLPRSDLNGTDQLRVFYPSQGVTRTAPALAYGSTVASVTRTVNSTDYSNYWRIIGNNGNSDQNAAQMYAEAWNSDANNVGVFPVGLWMSQDNSSDVNIQSTLNERAQGNLALTGILMPTYTLGLRPGAYTYGNPNIGDTLPLIIQSGRLNVNDTVRVVGIVYDVGDDGQEDVEITVARPQVTLAQILKSAHRDVNALARR